MPQRNKRKRQIQLKLLVLEEKLSEQGYTDVEIAEKLEETRKTLEAAAASGAAGGPTAPSASSSETQTHQIAALKEKQMEKLKAALWIGAENENKKKQSDLDSVLSDDEDDRAKNHKNDGGKDARRGKDEPKHNKMKEKKGDHSDSDSGKESIERMKKKKSKKGHRESDSEIDLKKKSRQATSRKYHSYSDSESSSSSSSESDYEDKRPKSKKRHNSDDNAQMKRRKSDKKRSSDNDASNKRKKYKAQKGKLPESETDSDASSDHLIRSNNESNSDNKSNYRKHGQTDKIKSNEKSGSGHVSDSGGRGEPMTRRERGDALEDDKKKEVDSGLDTFKKLEQLRQSRADITEARGSLMPTNSMSN
ncbi:PREDICTED: uncharacterized protein LOC109174254 [Ipomoea nil]|uniref:uncharacterized protein LOC109174254 n=1 Tax=Ipomoea nil TaxID=35883 RepID=UPI0009013D8A|nr:PREDICTED: uncharacterized protein LOC109174254 [Ipomoea nil]